MENEKGTNTISDALNTVKEMQEKLGGRKTLVEQFGHATVELLEPFRWTGNEYTVIDMDFRSMKGRDLIAVSDELAAEGQKADNPGSNLRYQIKFAARAAHIPSDVIENLPAADFNAVTQAARLFLLVTG